MEAWWTKTNGPTETLPRLRAVAYYRHSAEIGQENSVAIQQDSGAGDVYPAQGTTLIVAKQVTINTDFDGDDAVLFAAFATARAHADFQDSGSLSLEAVELAANEVWWWASSLGQANPLTGNAVDTVQVSNGTTAVATFKLGILYDSTP